MKTENLFLPEPLIHILEQITMPHLSANRDDIYVTSIKHAHSTTACGIHRLEEFRHWGKAGRADSSSCRDRGSCLRLKLMPIMLILWKGNSFIEKDVSARLVLGFPLFISLFLSRLILLVNPPSHFISIMGLIQLSYSSLSSFW